MRWVGLYSRTLSSPLGQSYRPMDLSPPPPGYKLNQLPRPPKIELPDENGPFEDPNPIPGEPDEVRMRERTKVAMAKGASQGDDLLAVLDEAAGRSLEPTEISGFFQSPEGRYVLENYESRGGIDDDFRPYIMEAFDKWSRNKTVPDDLVIPPPSR